MEWQFLHARARQLAVPAAHRQAPSEARELSSPTTILRFDPAPGRGVYQ